MARGNEIVLTAKGRFMEGIIEGTPKPGTIMQLKAGAALVGGRPTYQVYNADASGDRRPILVLDRDWGQGKTADDAYVTGTRGFLYAPAMGDELNVRVTVAGTGTGDAITIGDRFIVEDGTGLLIATTGTPESEPFESMEDEDDVTADGTLIHVVYTGY